MNKIEKEMRGQFEAIAKTLDELSARRSEAEAALNGVRSLCVLGCGSSFSLAKSAAMQFSQNTGIPACALPAGDVLVNFASYEKLLRDSALLLLSRSGSTSEVVRVAKRCKEELGCRVLSVCARVGAPVEEIADWSLCLPWAFDEAVCQTRTVSNLYLAALGLSYMAADRADKAAALSCIPELAGAFCQKEEFMLSDLAEKPWVKAVVLGDSGMAPSPINI